MTAGPKGAESSIAAATVDADTEIVRLAKLSSIDYDRERQAAAERLGCRVSTLDQQVQAVRGGKHNAMGQGRPPELPEMEPWPHPVDGAALLDEIVALFGNWIDMPEVAMDAIGLWVVHTHAFDAAEIAPRLRLRSPLPRCGKSNTLKVLSYLVPKPEPISNLTPAVLFRLIAAKRPTLLIDEAETFVNKDDEFRGLLNSGHSRDLAYVWRAVPTPGGDYVPAKFSTWAPMAIASIGKLSATLEDRSITIPLKRKKRGAVVPRFKRRLVARQAREIARRAARWVADHIEALRGCEPDVPDALNDRAADNWIPLLAIADIAGGVWKERARKAAKALSGDAEHDDESTLLCLLADICDIFAAKGVDRIASAVLCHELAEIEERAWGEYKNEKPITQYQLARLLKRFPIAPGSLRLHPNDKGTKKGYMKSDFADAFERYLSGTPDSNRNTGTTQANRQVEPDSGNGTSALCAGSENGQNPKDSAACAVVPVQKGGNGENTHKEAHESWPDLPPFLDRRPVRQADVDVADHPWGDQL